MWLLLILNLVGKGAALYVGSASPGTALALWFFPDSLVAYHLFVPRAQGLVRSCRFFPTLHREVWLTIDDGPDPEDTPLILQLLEKHRAKATFFVIGTNVAAHPELVQAIKAAGHEIAYHTHTHPVRSFWCASPSRLAQELDRGIDLLRQNGITPSRFRPPVGFKNLWLASALKRRQLTCIGWSARGLELQAEDADKVALRVLRDVRPGSILLLHEGDRLPDFIRVEAISKTLDQLSQLNYRCVIPQSTNVVLQRENCVRVAVKRP